MEKFNGNELVEGLLFVKSLASQENVERMALLSTRRAFKKNVKCIAALHDDTAGRDIDRAAIYDLLDYLEEGKYRTLVVNNIFDITPCGLDLKNFVKRVNGLGISILDLSLMAFVTCNDNEEC